MRTTLRTSIPTWTGFVNRRSGRNLHERGLLLVCTALVCVPWYPCHGTRAVCMASHQSSPPPPPHREQSPHCGPHCQPTLPAVCYTLSMGVWFSLAQNAGVAPFLLQAQAGAGARPGAELRHRELSYSGEERGATRKHRLHPDSCLLVPSGTMFFKSIASTVQTRRGSDGPCVLIWGADVLVTSACRVWRGPVLRRTALWVRQVRQVTQISRIVDRLMHPESVAVASDTSRGQPRPPPR